MFVGLHIFLKGYYSGLGSIGAFLMDIAVVILNWASTAHESYVVVNNNHFKMGIFSFHICKFRSSLTAELFFLTT